MNNTQFNDLIAIGGGGGGQRSHTIGFNGGSGGGKRHNNNYISEKTVGQSIQQTNINSTIICK